MHPGTLSSLDRVALLSQVISLTQMLGSSGQQRMATWAGYETVESSEEKDYVFRDGY